MAGGGAVKRDIHQAITERFIEQLKRGTVPCRDARLRAQRIGGFIGMPPDGKLRSLLALDHCDPLPPPGQYALPCPLSWLPDRVDAPAENGRKTNPSSPSRWGGQTGGYPFHLSSFWNHTTRLSVRHTHPAGYRYPNHQGEIRPPESVSTTPAHQEKTPVLCGVSSLSPVPEHLVFSDLSGNFPLPNVIEQSDFPWKSPSRFFAQQKISVLRASGALRSKSISS